MYLSTISMIEFEPFKPHSSHISFRILMYDRISNNNIYDRISLIMGKFESNVEHVITFAKTNFDLIYLKLHKSISTDFFSFVMHVYSFTYLKFINVAYKLMNICIKHVMLLYYQFEKESLKST